MTSLSVKPHLLRADTIDLQSQQNPSAKDHTRGQYNHGYASASNTLQPGGHHTQALRNANHEAFQEMQSSPRLGGFDHTTGPNGQMHIYDDGDEEEDDHMNNGINGSQDGNYDDGNDSQDEDMDDELLDKISSSPSIEDEDIDFEFVYALHTFVATVEGQANATKGDTMVLLDDSNSYWWLVRVVKDGSIGYLPAEHIETPTERLARLNKHRNIDLAAAMLGDNPEKSKNPLKKAIRRRNAKNVNFAPPTYYDADPRVWSDEEDEDEEGEEGEVVHVESNGSQQEQQAQTSQQQGQQAQSGQQIVQSSESQRVQPVAATIHRVESNEETEEEEEPSSPVKSNPSQVLTHNDSQENVRKTKTGIVRNTDSFYKDDSVETKKISLTPRLLRNDTDSTTSTDHELKRRASPDTFDKVIGEDKSKEGKKKEKKGMLSGLFKRKDKGNKGARSDTDETDRNSEDSGRSPQSKDSMDDAVTPERKASKLQKNPQAVASPKQSSTDVRGLQREPSLNASQQQGPTPVQKNQNEPSQLSHHSSQSTLESNQPQSQQQPVQAPGRFPSLQEKRSVFAPITGALRSKNSSQDISDSNVKPIYSKRAKERFAIDESDSEDDSTPTARSSLLHRSISPLENNVAGNARPDSEIAVSPLDTHDQNMIDKLIPTVATDVKERPGPSQQTNSTASPTTPSDQTASTSKHSPSVAGHTPSTSRSTPTWSDSSLRSYMENDQDIRDLLVIVHDKTNVMPVGHEHPLMNGLFASERTKLADMQSQLDSMLVSWLAKKKPPTGSGAMAKV